MPLARSTISHEGVRWWCSFNSKFEDLFGVNSKYFWDLFSKSWALCLNTFVSRNSLVGRSAVFLEKRKKMSLMKQQETNYKIYLI